MFKSIISLSKMYKAGGLLRIWHEFYENYFFDFLNSTDTSSRVLTKNYNKDIQNLNTACDYIPSYNASISKSISKIIKIDKKVLNEEFIDIGCGKGKALIIAFQMGFLHGTGFEINSELCEIGNENLKKKKIDHCFKIMNCNAVNSNIIPNFSICYLYNPFNEKMTKEFFRLIEMKKTKNKKYLIYVNPLYSYLAKEKFEIVTKFNVGTQDIEIWSF